MKPKHLDQVSKALRRSSNLVVEEVTIPLLLHLLNLHKHPVHLNHLHLPPHQLPPHLLLLQKHPHLLQHPLHLLPHLHQVEEEEEEEEEVVSVAHCYHLSRGSVKEV